MGKGDETGAEEATTKKSSGAIMLAEVREAVTALEMPVGRLLVSGLSAGLELGFSLFVLATVRSVLDGVAPAWATDLLAAAVYPFGFIIVVLGRSELFTEQTSLAVLPLLSGETTVRRVAGLWAVVLVANIVGAAIFALAATPMGIVGGIIKPESLDSIVRYKAAIPWWQIFWSAVLAGWLMGLLSWLVAAGRETISQIVIVWMIAGAIGLAHMNHAISGTTEVLSAVFWGSATAWQFGKFLLWTVLGNSFGGAVLVALLKFGHAGEQ
jgi:formate/nitrite transporter FocA (FNT family)